MIRLPGNPATGYQWQAATTNSPAVRLTVRPQYSPPASTAAQAAALGTYTFTFQAVQPGSGSIRLYYVRPGDPGSPARFFRGGRQCFARDRHPPAHGPCTFRGLAVAV